MRAVEPLIQTLGNYDSGIQSVAAEALGRLGDPRAVMPLIHGLESGLENGDHRLWPEALYALGKLADKRAVGPLIRALNNSADGYRIAAATALGQLGDLRAVSPLANALHGRRPVQWGLGVAVVTALARLGDSEANQALVEALESADGEISGWAAIVLAKQGDSRTVEPLIRALRIFDPEAAEALGELGDRRAIEPLIRQLVSSSLDSRRTAATALVRLGDTRWANWAQVEECNIRDLGKIGDIRAVARLIVFLDSGDIESRRSGAEELRHIALQTPHALQNYWPRIAGAVRRPHTDYMSVLCRTDVHDDFGIGLDFPDPPTADGYVSKDF